MKKLIIIMVLLALFGCTHIDKIDDPIISTTGIPGDTVSVIEEILNWIIMLWPPYGIR